MCDNCLIEKEYLEPIDITKESLEILEIIKTNYKKTGFNVGIIKLVTIIKQISFNRKTKEYIKEVLEILINKDILKILLLFETLFCVNNINVEALLPIKAHINTKNNVSNNKSIFNKLLMIRNSISLKYVIIPSVLTLLKDIHFNPNHPENHNVKIPNRKEKFAIVYMNGQWKLRKKSEVISSMVDMSYNIVDCHFEDNKMILSDTKRNNFIEFQSNYDNGKLKRMIEGDLEIEILNN